MSGEYMEQAPRPANQKSIFVKRKRVFTIAFLAVLAIYLISSNVADFSAISAIRSIPAAFLWITSNFVPDGQAFSRLPIMLEFLMETALVSVAVTVCAAICAFFFSLLGTKTTKANPIVARVVRIIAAFFRNVPDVVWAILLLFTFGQNILTGFFALFFYTFGLMTRTFIETIDEVSSSCVEALRATGASSLQIVTQGIIPSSMSVIVSWVLYMIETNIRASTLIGVLTSTGIGFLFDTYYKRMEYGSASLVVLLIVVLVISIELISTQIRKVIL